MAADFLLAGSEYSFFIRNFENMSVDLQMSELSDMI